MKKRSGLAHIKKANIVKHFLLEKVFCCSAEFFASLFKMLVNTKICADLVFRAEKLCYERSSKLKFSEKTLGE